ncbi:hypothetical protein M8453_23445 [Citrobacter freundii]|uniref:hypothetical protein n=1 Tax=Citrobacter freundii TaxID=546 RepID=UPI00214D5D11|nr:hypothetical protein [Citrobacter freundii]MCR3717492.1 hypothetical protein [Citrobacter freundii]
MTTFTKEQLIEQAKNNLIGLKNYVTVYPERAESEAMNIRLAEIALAALGTDTRENPVLAYADSYRSMAMQGVKSIPILNVITDLERNIAPLYTYTPTTESEDRKMLKRLAVIMSGSDSGGEISALTVTAQSLVDRCKALACGKEKLVATESLALGVKCPFPYGWEELKRRTNQDILFFSAYMVEGEEVTDLHRDIVDRMVDRLLKVITACQTDASYSGPTTWNPASLEEVNKRSVRESTDTDFPSREAIIAGGVLVQCPQCHGDSYYLKKGGNHYWCDKCANETVTIRNVYMEYRKLVDSLGIDISKQPANVRDAMWYGFSLAKSTGTKMTEGK